MASLAPKPDRQWGSGRNCKNSRNLRECRWNGHRMDSDRPAETDQKPAETSPSSCAGPPAQRAQTSQTSLLGVRHSVALRWCDRPNSPRVAFAHVAIRATRKPGQRRPFDALLQWVVRRQRSRIRRRSGVRKCRLSRTPQSCARPRSQSARHRGRFAGARRAFPWRGTRTPWRTSRGCGRAS
jgi:hypothetical protein